MPSETGTAKRTTAKKTTSKTASKTAAAASTVAEEQTEAKPRTPRKPRTKAAGQPLTAEARLGHIEVAAYYIAEKSGFSSDPETCWLAAEREIDNLLLSGKLTA